MSESKVQNEIRLAAGLDVTLFRNNVALAAAGKIHWVRQPQTVQVGPGDAVVRQARPLHAGLCKGSSDLVGDRSVIITPDMVGKRVALAAYIECKDGNGQPTDEQVTFIEQAQKRGALAGIARSVADAHAILRGDAPPVSKTIKAKAKK